MTHWARVIAPDLPGHGFTRLGSPQRAGLDTMAEDLWHLCDTAGYAPDVLVGHSAGAAVALRMAELRRPRGVIGINGALSGFDGLAGVLFPVFAKALALAPGIPQIFARMNGGDRQAERLLSSTGSRIDPEGRRLYARLLRDPQHVDGALRMMAQWRLDGLLQRLPMLDVPVWLVAGRQDKTVKPSVSRLAASRLPNARFMELDGLGHLAHEEAPDQIAAVVAEVAQELDLTATVPAGTPL